MTKLASSLASKNSATTTKAYILLDAAGGTSTTGELISLGKDNGVKTVSKWNLASIFSRNPERVARMNGGWKLLEDGYAYLERCGYAPNSRQEAVPTTARRSKGALNIVIGHGRSPLWKELRDWLVECYDFKIHEFNSQSVAGTTTKDRLAQLLDVSDVALLLMTAEDMQHDGQLRARMNVIHEIGLFQGRLGFENAPILLEEGCEEFSNIAGLGQIRFPKGDLNPAYRELTKYFRDKQKP
jgi:hypothetical protein